MRYAILGCLFAVLALTGCTMPSQFVWTADSQGFYYSDTLGGNLVYYDATSMARRVVLHNAEHLTQVPGVRPDGKRIALIRAVSHPAEDTAEVIVVDAEGKEVGRSNILSWASENSGLEKPKVREAAAFWSPRGAHILFWFNGGKKGAEKRFGIHDVEKGKARPLAEDVVPMSILRFLGISPVSDDGRGFLANKESEGEEGRFYFVDWTGKPLLLEPTDEGGRFLQDLFTSMQGSGEETSPRDNLVLPIRHGKWENGIARLVLGGGVLSFDTRAGKIDYHRDPKLAKEREKLLEEKVQLWIPLGKGKYAVRNYQQAEKTPVYVELAEPATGKVTRLGEVVNELTSLSPDRSRAAVAYEKDDQVWMSLIDEEQGIVDKQRLR